MAVGDRTQLAGTAYDRLRILTTCRTIAMVGLSANPYHPSDFAAIYLAANGYKIIPVNPSQAGKTILGERVYSRIDEIDHPVDIVDVFRPSAEVPDIAHRQSRSKPKCCGSSLALSARMAARSPAMAALKWSWIGAARSNMPASSAAFGPLASIPASSPPD
jgi:predicted CoA-binding protein